MIENNLNEYIDWAPEVVEETWLSTGSNIKFSPNEDFVKTVLEKCEIKTRDRDWNEIMVKGDPESLLKQVFEDSQKIVTQNAKWDILPDYKSRAQIKLKLLESMWVVKWKQPDVKVNFLNILFWKW